jgi:aryl-alcohol dehydrogenase-like predicted oxidoreductase
VPDSEAITAWIRRNEAARAEDRRRDAQRSMSERLEQAVRLSRTASELAENLGRSPDVRTG